MMVLFVTGAHRGKWLTTASGDHYIYAEAARPDPLQMDLETSVLRYHVTAHPVVPGFAFAHEKDMAFSTLDRRCHPEVVTDVAEHLFHDMVAAGAPPETVLIQVQPDDGHVIVTALGLT